MFSTTSALYCTNSHYNNNDNIYHYYNNSAHTLHKLRRRYVGLWRKV